MTRLRKIGSALLVGALAGATLSARVQAEPSRSVGVGVERVLEVLEQIDRTLVSSSYSHVTRVDTKSGLYDFDCSGMAAWVLQRGAPGAYQAVLARSATGRPVARDFYRAIAAISPSRPSWAWQRVARLEDARPGDVIAWLKPEGRRSDATGHVGFVLAAPTPSTRIDGAFLFRFADASRYQHDDDSRTATGRDGFGNGTILLSALQDGSPAAFGWFGDRSAWLAETRIAIGRPLR
jgi:hypothetical protein